MGVLILFKVRDTKITSTASPLSTRRKNVTIAWNEPQAAFFIGENVPTEHLMYVLEINPPLDKGKNKLVLFLQIRCTIIQQLVSSTNVHL